MGSKIQLSGRIFLTSCSPPFGALLGTDFPGADGNVWRACVGDTAGQASMYTDFNDGAITSEGVHNPVLSPCNTKILFELANPSTGYTEIWVVANTPNSTATQLIADASNYVMMPMWHPDCDQFTYVHGAGGSLLGSVKKSSVSSPGITTTLKSASGTFSPFRPAFNYDGSKIAYVFDQNIGGTGQLRVMNSDGTGDTSIDSAVRYRFQGAQFSWALSMNVICYDDGVPSGTNAAYIINSDGTGQTQVNAAGDAASTMVRVSHTAWPPTEDYVIFQSFSGFGGGPARGELDGSTSTSLNLFNGPWSQDYFRQVILYNQRIWYIKSATQLASMLLDGTDVRNDLTITGAEMDDFSNGDGWYYN